METLKPCPFCGCEAKIINEPEGYNFQIIGCTSLEGCPRPTIAAYRRNGEFDYYFWNKRTGDEE